MDLSTLNNHLHINDMKYYKQSLEKLLITLISIVLISFSNFGFCIHGVRQIMSFEEAQKKIPPLNFKGMLKKKMPASFSARKMVVVDFGSNRKRGRIIIPFDYFYHHEVINIVSQKTLLTFCPIIQNLSVYKYEGKPRKFFVTGKLYKGSLVFQDDKNNEFKQFSGRPLQESGENYLRPHGFSIIDQIDVQDGDTYLYVENLEKDIHRNFPHGYRVLTSWMFSPTTLEFFRNLFNFHDDQNDMVVTILDNNERVISTIERITEGTFFSDGQFASYTHSQGIERVLINTLSDNGPIFYLGNKRGLNLLLTPQ